MPVAMLVDLRDLRLGLLLVAAVTAGCEESAAAPRPVASAKPVAAPVVSAKPPAPPCPADMAHVASFCIDRYEAHLTRADGAEHSPYERPKAGERYVAVSRAGVVPQGYVSREEAEAACAGAGKRLCRAVEWYRACSGAGGDAYPYGPKLEKGKCNVGKPHLLTKVFGHVFFTKLAHYNNPRVNQEPGFLAKTGEYSECVTDSGVFDMVGNLHEWVADDVSAKLIKEVPFEKGDQWFGKRGMGVFMGGYFSSHAEHGHGCRYATATHAPEYHDYSTGFRCCK